MLAVAGRTHNAQSAEVGKARDDTNEFYLLIPIEQVRQVGKYVEYVF